MPETLFLTMNVIDRFLEQKPMTRKNLQLVSSLTVSVLACCLCVHCSNMCAHEVQAFGFQIKLVRCAFHLAECHLTWSNYLTYWVTYLSLSGSLLASNIDTVADCGRLVSPQC